MARKNRNVPPQEEPPLPLTQVRYVITTGPRTSDPVDGYYALFHEGFSLCSGKGTTREAAIADLLPKLQEHLLREWQESKHKLLPIPLPTDAEINTIIVSIPDIFGEKYALPDEQRRKKMQQQPRVAIYIEKLPDEWGESIKRHFASRLPECRTYAKEQGWQVVALYDEAEHPKKTSLFDNIRAGTVDIVLVHSLHELSHKKGEVLTLYEEMKAAGVRLYKKGEGDFASLLQEDERFTNFIYQLDPTLHSEWIDTYTAAQQSQGSHAISSTSAKEQECAISYIKEQECAMSYIEERNGSLDLSRQIQQDIEAAIYLCAPTEAELVEQETRCKALAKEQGFTVLAIYQELVADEDGERRRALVRIFLRPFPFQVVIVDDLTRFASEREIADDIIVELYRQHCYVFPVREDDFKRIDQRLEKEEKQ